MSEFGEGVSALYEVYTLGTSFYLYTHLPNPLSPPAGGNRGQFAYIQNIMYQSLKF
jgi:hypothetical protein